MTKKQKNGVMVVGTSLEPESGLILSSIRGPEPFCESFIVGSDVRTKENDILVHVEEFENGSNHSFVMSKDDFSTIMMTRAAQRFPENDGVCEQRFVPVARWEKGLLLYLDRSTFPSSYGAVLTLGVDVCQSFAEGVELQSIVHRGQNVVPTNSFFLVAALFSEIQSVRESAELVLNGPNDSMLACYINHDWVRSTFDSLKHSASPMESLLDVDPSAFRRSPFKMEQNGFVPPLGELEIENDLSHSYPTSGLLALASIGDNAAARALRTSVLISDFFEHVDEIDEVPLIFSADILEILIGELADVSSVRDAIIESFPISLLMSETGSPTFSMSNVNESADLVSEIMGGEGILPHPYLIKDRMSAACFLVSLCARRSSSFGPEPELDTNDMYPLMFAASMAAKSMCVRLDAGEEDE